MWERMEGLLACCYNHCDRVLKYSVQQVVKMSNYVCADATMICGVKYTYLRDYHRRVCIRLIYQTHLQFPAFYHLRCHNNYVLRRNHGVAL